MSRLRSASSAIVASALLLAGCGNHAGMNAPNPSGIGYVQLDEVIKHHPLYAQLSQMDDAIAAFDLTSLGGPVPSGADAKAQIAELDREVKQAQARADAEIARKRSDYQQREAQADRAALAAAGISGPKLADQGTQVAQEQAAVQQAGKDYAAFQKSLMDSGNAQIQSIVQSLNQQAQRKVEARVEQLQQGESQLALSLSQQNASARVPIKTRLSNLALDDATRASLQQQLNDLDKKETTALAARRAADNRELDAYKAQVERDRRAAIAAEVAKINTATQAKLAARRSDVNAQLRTIGTQQALPSIPPGMQAKLQAIHQDFSAQFQQDVQKTVDAYNQTKADLDLRYATLTGDVQAANAAKNEEVTGLQGRRAALYDKISAQVASEASRIAQTHHLRLVVSVTSSSVERGGYDLTDEVTKDVESLHE